MEKSILSYSPRKRVSLTILEFNFDPDNYSAESTREQLATATTVGSLSDLGRHSGGERNDLLAEVRQRQKAFHDVLRAFFLETRESGPAAFAKRLHDDLDKLLWEPPTDKEKKDALISAEIPKRLIEEQLDNFQRIRAELRMWF